MDEDFEYEPNERIVILVGNFGSGKTEVAVNLAIRLARRGPVAIADLDIVNPYFRCREARREMQACGVRVLYPEGEYHAADLPILLPEIRGALQGGEGALLLDVGGDDMGAKVLSSLADVFTGRPYVMLQVLNARRPFTETLEGCLAIRAEIEAASRLRIGGLVSNTHLMEETQAATVLEGLRLAREVGRAAGVPVAFVTANEGLRGEIEPRGIGAPVLWIRRRMLPPWKLERKADRAERVLRRDGAGAAGGRDGDPAGSPRRRGDEPCRES